MAPRPSQKPSGDGTTFLVEDAQELIRTDGIEVVVEATGNPPAGIRHALACFEAGRHIVMVNVEADVLAGPLLARKAEEAGVACAMAYGDQPALIYEMVDWARTCGLEVVAGRQGHQAHGRITTSPRRRPCGSITASTPNGRRWAV